ncbi:MAG: phosphoadenosine phosphosulfate reductase family protein [Armatimonadota bacterium]|nr:phosphoadenosine phosphosulfate reductase family protein [Armatimonadota bacterium]
MMPERWRQTFLAWAQTNDHRRALEDARRRIRDALAHSRRPFVSYSGGKDSTAMLHFVLQEAPDIMVLHWDYGRAFVPQPVHEEILHIARTMGVRNLRVETSPLYERLGRRATNVMGRHLIGRLLPQLAAEGYDLDFVGLRAEESLKRRRRIRRQKRVSMLPECWPLQDWRWLDVWAYLVAHGVPYLSLYDVRAALVGYDQARFTTLFDPEFADVGSEMDNVLHWRWRNQQ